MKRGFLLGALVIVAALSAAAAKEANNSSCATLEPAVTLNHHATAGIIRPIGIIGAGIRVGRGRVM